MFFIIDGSSLLSTNYYGTLPKELLFEKDEIKKQELYKKIMQTKDGVFTNGVYGTLKYILNLVNNYNPEGIIICFDKTRNTFRKKIYPEYKNNREVTPSPLKEQFILMEDICEKIGLPTFYSEEYEADDYAGSVCRLLEKDKKECILISADKDYYQLVSPYTKLWRIVNNQNKEKLIKFFGNITPNLPSNIYEFTYDKHLLGKDVYLDIYPEQFIDYLALEGDKVDNIPGVKGCGEKSIIPLLKEYESLENLYSELDEIQTYEDLKNLKNFWKNELNIKKTPINYLIEQKDLAYLSKELATIKTDISIPNNIDFYFFNLNHNNLLNILDKYEMHSLKSILN